MSKYHAKRITNKDGTFDSKKEYERWCHLKMLEKSGVITGLERQVKYVLIHTQREPDIVGVRGGRHPGKLLEKECSYKADFVYRYTDTGEEVVEDVKGVRTEAYMIKKKLMLWVHGIRIREVR